jgi:FkbM family methyltransferase
MTQPRSGKTGKIGMSLPLDCIIAGNDYGLYCVPLRSKHRPASSEIINGRVWEPETIALIRRFAGAGDVIHAGTFFGDFLPAISKALAPPAKIWAFEPNSESFQAASITCRLNDLRNVELRNAGLSERSTRRLLTTGQNGHAFGGASRILERESAANEDTEEIDVLSIDSLIPPDRHVSVLQLDVEGHERAALAGGYETISRCRPLIVLETLPPHWVKQHLAPLGYRFVGRRHENSILAPGGITI